MSHQSTINKALVLINTTVNELGLPTRVRREALNIYSNCSELRLTQGRKTNNLVGACLLIGAELNNYPINNQSLCESLDTSMKELIRNKQFIKRLNNIKSMNDPSAYVTRYCHELGLNEKEISKALINIKRIDDGSRTPQAIAVISVYSAYKITANDLARISGLSNNHVRRLIKLTQAAIK
ncbi:MAG: hypothetical protein WC307_05905 [Candidatus Nanoarchaeia archaeon]|jgi:transcription initiation factor TFIIIB Brf1 subunit/transcription initiation factor TFIIB